jgi:RNA polymerase sigma-70 factor (ECF subfamily)
LVALAATEEKALVTREPPGIPPPASSHPPPSLREATDERAAFRQLYERTSPRIAAYLRRVTKSPEWSEDLLQDTYVRFLNADPPPMDERQTLSYLFRIATNLVYDGWRSMRREKEWEAVTPADVTPPEPVDLRRDVEEALARLSARERALVWLAYVEGYAHKDIARVLEVKDKSVRVLLFRARRKLAKILEEAGLTPEVLG